MLQHFHHFVTGMPVFCFHIFWSRLLFGIALEGEEEDNFRPTSKHFSVEVAATFGVAMLKLLAIEFMRDIKEIKEISI